MNIVLFLGAGFSRAWNLPVMNEFFSAAKKSKRITAEEKDWLRNLQRRARSGVSMLEGSEGNLEHILSFCLMADRVSGVSDETRSPERLYSILTRIYSDMVQPQDDPAKPFKEMLGLDQRSSWDHSLTIITTNYDVTIEFLMYRLGLHTTLPCAWTAVDGGTFMQAGALHRDGNAGTIKLCKLHGSLNWFDDPKNESNILVDSRVASIQHFDPSANQPSSRPYVCCTDYKCDRVPLIVPPTLFKMETDKRFDAIWRCAGKALSEAERVTFIGYSFPASDSYMEYFLATSLVENTDLRRIDVLDPNGNGIVNRLLNQGTAKYGATFKGLLAPIDTRWEISSLVVTREQ